MSKEVYVRYTVPVYALVEIDESLDAHVRKVVVEDEKLSDILAYEDEDQNDLQPSGRFSEDEEQAVNEALGGEWPAWEFGW